MFRPIALLLATVLMACPSTSDRPVDDDRSLATLSPDERSDWCTWREATLGVVDADGFVACEDSMGWPAGTVSECAANDDLFVDCAAGLAAACIEATATDPCATSQPAACAELDACIAALPPSNGIACGTGECSCRNGPPVTTEVQLVRYGDTDYCVPLGDGLVCNGTYPSACW